MDYGNFVSQAKAALVAPAGYGKTYTIVKCVETSSGKQLILTHTHAGVASLKDKLHTSNIPSDRYHVETISSFAQKYHTAFYGGTDTPEQTDKDYHPFVLKSAISLFEKKSIYEVFSSTYEGLFVDEFQDCSKLQNQLIVALAKVVKIRIFGDPLQGIFDFNGDIIDFDEAISDFVRFPDLHEPQRWIKTGRRELGEKIKAIRDAILAGTAISEGHFKDANIHFLKTSPGDMYNPKSDYRKWLDKLIRNPDKNPDLENLLIISPTYYEIVGDVEILKGDINQRKKIKSSIDPANRVRLLESIDDRTFYSLSAKLDDLLLSIHRARKPEVKIKTQILAPLFGKSAMNKWFNAEGLIDKRTADEQQVSSAIAGLIESFIEQRSLTSMKGLLAYFVVDLKYKCSRIELYNTLIKAIDIAIQEESSVYLAMNKQRNLIRALGRRIEGRNLGTTLLTKGLECDVVAILDAHKFDCEKHFYVAISRCTKKLIVFSETSQFTFSRNSDLGPESIQSNKLTTAPSRYVVNFEGKLLCKQCFSEHFHEMVRPTANGRYFHCQRCDAYKHLE